MPTSTKYHFTLLPSENYEVKKQRAVVVKGAHIGGGGQGGA